ncbi:MAG: hypothetical protein ACRDMX_11345 [Solirubrobacteraceae bacterium]
MSTVLAATTARGRLVVRHPLTLAKRVIAIRPLVNRADVGGASLAVLGSLLAAAWSLQLWHAHLHVPFAYGSDALDGQMMIKSVISGGWIWHIHGLGAPFVNEMYDFPLGTDSLNFLTIKILGLGSSNSAVILNVFFLLTFATVALSAYVVLRWIGLSVLAAVVCAVLFSDSPYHLFRGEAHLLLSSYPSVPMGTYLILKVIRDGRLFRARVAPSPVIFRLLTWRNAFTVLVCVMIGSLGVYYAVFAALLIATAGALAPLASRSWRPLLHALGVVALIGGTAFANDLPIAIYRSQHGSDALVAARIPAESELYALKLAEMMLPVPGHRIAALANIRHEYDSTTPIPSEDAQQSLGIIGALSLAWLMLLALASVLGLARPPSLRRQRELAFAAVSAFLLGTLGGVSALIGYLVTSQIRGWDRISIFIAFFAIAAFGLGLDALRRRLRDRRRYLWLALVPAVVAIGIYDQSSPLAVPPYAANYASYVSDGQFVAGIQTRVPRGSAIFQLPYVPYPENPPVDRMMDYDLGRGYVHTTTGLRWSYGAMKGRPQDWAGADDNLPVPTLLDGVVAAGFSGVYIDKFGYVDNAASLAAAIQADLHTKPLVSPDGRLMFFNLQALARRLRATVPNYELAGLRYAILHPLSVAWGSGFYGDENGSRWSQPDSTAAIDNPTPVAQRVVFSATMFSLARGRWHASLTAPDGEVRHFVIRRKPVHVQMVFIDPPGTHVLTFKSDVPIVPVAGDPRRLAVRFQNDELVSAAESPFLSPSPPTGDY